MSITHKIVENLRDDINEALKTVGEKYGLAIEAGPAGFTETSVRFKLKAVNAQENWNNCVAYTGLQPDDFGKIGLFGGTHKLKIIGIVYRNARINKVDLIDPETGKRFRATVSETISALNALDPARIKRVFDVKAFECGLKGRVVYGQTFELGGETYKIVDLNTKAPKYPIIAENAKGVRYCFDKSVLPATKE